MPTPAPLLPAWLLAAGAVSALESALQLRSNLDMRREVVPAIVSLVIAFLALPRGRQRLAIWPLVLLLSVPLPYLAAMLFPDSPDGPAAALLGERFFLLASLLQSLILLVAVAAWERLRRPMPRIFLDVLRCLMVAAAVLAILYQSGVEPGSLFTGSAVVTAVLGFALKDTLGNAIAGLAIHAEHPFEVGDWIQYDDNTAHIGRVVEINWRATKVITLDEAFVIIPNGQLAQASIRNFTKPDPWSRRNLYVITPYAVPPQRVQEIVLDAIRGSFGVLDHPAPSVVTNAFTERGVEHWVRLFTTEFDKRDRVDGMARDRIWYALARAGIEIPVATHAVRMTPLPPPPAEDASAAADRRVAALTAVGLLEPLGDPLVRRLAAESAERLYGIGETVIRQGDAGTTMFVVLSGRVEVSAREGDAPAVRLAELAAGNFFGEMSMMTGAPRVATVTTLEETRLVEIGKEVFRHALENRPELVEHLGRALQRRMDRRAAAVAGVPPADPEAQDLFTKIREFFSL
ncbi:MAG: mechanosensitive ion channel [Planctomycetes bacterium]|nr:mechanosensitive ion channel [Planctomycetota bacterium]